MCTSRVYGEGTADFEGKISGFILAQNICCKDDTIYILTAAITSSVKNVVIKYGLDNLFLGYSS